MQFNQIILTGRVKNIKMCLEDTPSCKHKYFDLVFNGALSEDSINVCDWTSSDINEGDTVQVIGQLQSNQRSINDGYTDVKEVFIMVYGDSSGNSSVIKVDV